MKRITTLSLLVLFALTISACAGPSAPTVSAAEVQGTAVAAAYTMVAQTQAAIPTATPLPPTETPTQTPLPTETPPPTLASPVTTFTSAPVAVNNTPGGDPCATRVLSWSPKGQPTTIRIVNKTKATITVSLYLNETPDHFECGYRAYTLIGLNDVVINDLVQGCYSLWAFSNDPKIHVNASGYGCINNPDKWTIQIFQERVVGP